MGQIFVKWNEMLGLFCTNCDLSGPWTHTELMNVVDATNTVSGINSLAPGGFDYSLKSVNFKFISTINIIIIFCEIAIRWMPQHLTDH